VFSRAAYKLEETVFRKELNQKRELASKSLKHLSQQEFATKEAAQAAIAELEKQWEFHQAKVDLEGVFHYSQPGRPKKGHKPDHIKWMVWAK